MATVSWEVQMCAVPSHGIPIGMTFLWTSLCIRTGHCFEWDYDRYTTCQYAV